MMSKKAFMTSLILTGGIISIKMLSIFIYGHKKRSFKGCNSLQSFVFCRYSVVMPYLRGFQLLRIFFQPERIASVFNSGEMGLILASIDFVGTKSVIEYTFFLLLLVNRLDLI